MCAPTENPFAALIVAVSSKVGKGKAFSYQKLKYGPEVGLSEAINATNGDIQQSAGTGRT
jgi:hypothetical protein